jgi:hypothetical protein
MLVKGSFAFGDGQKTGANDVAGTNAGNIVVLGTEGKVFDGVADYGIDVTKVGARSSEGGANNGSHVFNHYYVNVRPLPGNKNLKLTAQYNTYKGWEGSGGAASGTGMTSYEDKNTNFVVSYNFDGKAEVGLGVSHTNGVGTTRFAGRGIMLGGSYFLSKSVQVYAGLAKNSYKDGGGYKGWRYDGTGALNSATRTFENGRTVKVGIMKEF